MRGQDCPDRRGWTLACLLAVTDPLFTILYFSSKEFTNSLVIKHPSRASHFCVRLSLRSGLWPVRCGLSSAPDDTLQPPGPVSPLLISPQFITRVMNGPAWWGSLWSPEYKTLAINCPGRVCCTLHSAEHLQCVCVYKVIMMWPPMVSCPRVWPH